MSLSDATPAPQADNRRARRQRAIVEVAARVFAEAGYDEAEMERVAAVSGIGKGTLYLYFPGKQELFFACVDEGMRQLQAVLRAAAEGDDDPFVRIGRGIRGYLEFFDRNPHYAELLIQERAIFKDRKEPTYFEYRKENLGPWRDVYAQLAAQGRTRADLPIEWILDTVGSLLYGAMFIAHFTGRKVPVEEHHQHLLDIILFGILTPAERERRSPG